MTGKHLCRIAILFSMFVFAAMQPGSAQQRRGFGRPQPQPPTISDDGVPSPAGPSLNRKMLKASYEQLQKDVQHLSELADELKDQVTTTDNEDTLSLSTVKKAEEIEKLAKKIQSRIKNL